MTRAKVRECPTLPLLRLHREQRVMLIDGVWVDLDAPLPWWVRLMLWDWRKL